MKSGGTIESTECMTIDDKRQCIRQEALRKRDNIPPEARHELSRDINARTIDFIKTQAIESVMLYLGMGSEVETCDLLGYLLQTGKIALAPTIEAKRLVPRRITDASAELVRHRYGMRQPNRDICPKFPPDQIDLIVVPGIAFDLKKYRIGYGGGVLRSIPAEMSSSDLVGIGVQGTSDPRTLFRRNGMWHCTTSLQPHCRRDLRIATAYL